MIRLQVLRHSDDGHVMFRVSEQSDRMFDDFTASNGIWVRSIDGPEWMRDRDQFFVRGKMKEYDSYVMTSTDGEYRKIEKAVDELNEHWKSKIHIGVRVKLPGSVECRLVKTTPDRAILLREARALRMDGATMAVVDGDWVARCDVSQYIGHGNWSVRDSKA